jgi:hypothetical protein
MGLAARPANRQLREAFGPTYSEDVLSARMPTAAE